MVWFVVAAVVIFMVGMGIVVHEAVTFDPKK